jgi:hypothetical protein
VSSLTPMPEYPSQIEFLRDLVAAFNSCREDSIDSLSIEELVNIYRCWLQCGWDYYPDNWTLRQIKEATRGICPDWDDNGKAVYAPDRRADRRVPYVSLKVKEVPA